MRSRARSRRARHGERAGRQPWTGEDTLFATREVTTSFGVGERALPIGVGGAQPSASKRDPARNEGSVAVGRQRSAGMQWPVSTTSSTSPDMFSRLKTSSKGSDRPRQAANCFRSRLSTVKVPANRVRRSCPRRLLLLKRPPRGRAARRPGRPDIGQRRRASCAN